jgi:hypothetical protein
MEEQLASLTVKKEIKSILFPDVIRCVPVRCSVAVQVIARFSNLLDVQ